MSEEDVSVTTAASICGIKQVDLSNLIYQEVVVPDRFEGRRAVLSPRNVREFKIIQRLKMAGVKRSYIKGILALLRKSSQQWLEEESWIVIENGDSWYITSNPSEPRNAKRIKENETTIMVRI